MNSRLKAKGDREVNTRGRPTLLLSVALQLQGGILLDFCSPRRIFDEKAFERHSS